MKRKSFDIPKRLVMEAWCAVKRARGGPGIDGVTIEKFEENLTDNLYKIWNRLSSGAYFPKPIRQVAIPKSDGKGIRLLGVPTVGDRVAQTVVKMKLEQAVEPHFHEDSYGSRPKRSARQAVELCRKRCFEYRWVVDLDIRAYFDTIRHDLLLRAVDRHATTPWEKLYIRRWLRNEVVTPEGVRYSPTCGMTQGATISPLLANLFLHYALDMWMKREQPDIPFERYMDDVIVHCWSEKQARFIRDKIAQRLKSVGLELHPEKTKVVYCQKYLSDIRHAQVTFSFLGFDFKPRKTAPSRSGKCMTFTPAVGQRGKKRLSQAVRSLRLPSRTDLAVEDIAEKLNPFLRGWIEYYRHFRRKRPN